LEYYANPVHHARLMRVVHERLGHTLIGMAESAKIAVSAGGDTTVDCTAIEAGLQVTLTEKQALDALDADLNHIVTAAHHTVQLAGLKARDVSALYFTGGSTGLRLLTQRLHAGFPQAHAVQGEAFSSVASGLGVYAKRLFGAD
jgi:hypothetical chaperone protein